LEPVKLIIDGREVRASSTMTVLQAALAAEMYIPHLCFDPLLKAQGGCRLCLVEIKGMRGMPASCVTTVAEGMEVTTNSPELERVRRDTLELILADHPDNCLTCVKNQECQLQKVTGYLGMQTRRVAPLRDGRGIDTSNPVFDIDRDYCVLCQRCVRACNELVHADVISVMQRGPDSRIGMFMEPSEMLPICGLCKICLEHCPVAALSLKKENNHPAHPRVKCPPR